MNEDYRQLIKEIDFDQLTDWEEKFVLDMDEKVRHDIPLTISMESKLKEIYEKTNGGVDEKFR